MRLVLNKKSDIEGERGTEGIEEAAVGLDEINAARRKNLNALHGLSTTQKLPAHVIHFICNRFTVSSLYPIGRGLALLYWSKKS